MKQSSVYILLLFSAVLVAQPKFVLKDSVQLTEKDTITDFSVDELGNIYYISSFSVLKKLIRQQQDQNYLDELLSFSDRTNINKLNVQNTLQITIKSSLFNLLVLDNRLQLIQDAIQFPIENNFTPTLTSLLDTNYLWGYDPILQKLILWDYQNEQIFRESVIITDIDLESDFKDLFYKSRSVYLLNNQKILVFDEFANLIEVIPFSEYKKAIFLRNSIVFSNQENELFLLDLNTKNKTKIELEVNFQDFSINNNALFVLNKKLIYIYKPEPKEEK